MNNDLSIAPMVIVSLLLFLSALSVAISCRGYISIGGVFEKVG